MVNRRFDVDGPNVAQSSALYMSVNAVLIGPLSSSAQAVGRIPSGVRMNNLSTNTSTSTCGEPISRSRHWNRFCVTGLRSYSLHHLQTSFACRVRAFMRPLKPRCDPLQGRCLRNLLGVTFASMRSAPGPLIRRSKATWTCRMKLR